MQIVRQFLQSMHQVTASHVLVLVLSIGLIMVVVTSIQHRVLGTEAATDEEQLSGGINFTTFDQSGNCFGQPGSNLSESAEAHFVTGNSFFRTNWVTAPGSVKIFDGLGPLMNAISCGSCHFKDGRGRPQAFNEALKGLVFRLSIPGGDQHNAPLGDPNYGGQFQDKSILLVEHEGSVSTTYDEVIYVYPDKRSVKLRKPVYQFYDLKYGKLASKLTVSPRIAQQLPGLGLLQNIPDEVVLSMTDERDANGDGISGKVNYVWDETEKKTMLGRFGWKANQSSLVQQVAAAFVNDIGITSSLYQEENLSPLQLTHFSRFTDGGTPEITDENLKKVVTYIKLLAVPAQRDQQNPKVLQGRELFDQIKCSTCHIPVMQTGDADTIDALNRQTIRPYTDLLLHDMGQGLTDNRADFLASGSEWRTAPLWGIGMLQTVNKYCFLLHDGRARNFEEAILWHGGEAAGSRKYFSQLSQDEREALICFLKSL